MDNLIMVAGDVVNGVNLSTSFIPAAGVEICILSLQGLGGDVNAGLSNGVSNHSNAYNSGVSGTNFSLGIKFFITNTVYLARVGGDNVGYSGIQIK
jgi:hypothetical protein|tara:strand:+ start:472 stop:759 length:288 start_codon:yes stop_codon:yes gene_type:complete